MQMMYYSESKVYINQSPETCNNLLIGQCWLFLEYMSALLKIVEDKFMIMGKVRVSVLQLQTSCVYIFSHLITSGVHRRCNISVSFNSGIPANMHRDNLFSGSIQCPNTR